MIPASEQIAASRRALRHGSAKDGRLTARVLIALAVVLTALMIVAPLAYIFRRAFADGLQPYWAAITTPDTLHAIWLTVIVTLVVVPGTTPTWWEVSVQSIG